MQPSCQRAVCSEMVLVSPPWPPVLVRGLTRRRVCPTCAATAVGFGYRRDLEQTYELGSVIGAGGYGVVRAAKDRATGEQLAVKSIPKHRAGLSPQIAAAYRDKLRSEVETHARLGASLDVLFLADVFEDDTHIHLAMERASGGGVWSSPTLADGRFSEQEAADVMRSVLRAVAQCHAAGVVFRDIKPDNFLRTDGGTLKLSDFGLAARCLSARR